MVELSRVPYVEAVPSRSVSNGTEGSPRAVSSGSLLTLSLINARSRSEIYQHVAEFLTQLGFAKDREKLFQELRDPRNRLWEQGAINTIASAFEITPVTRSLILLVRLIFQSATGQSTRPERKYFLLLVKPNSRPTVYRELLPTVQKMLAAADPDPSASGMSLREKLKSFITSKLGSET